MKINEETDFKVIQEPMIGLIEPNFCGFCGTFCTPIIKPF
jgi:hypothetical protein